MNRAEKIEKLIHDIYKELYLNAQPVGDFDELLKNAVVNDRGEKEIPFLDYEILEDKQNEIIEKHLNLKGGKLSKIEQNQIKFTVLLGCAPKTKNNN